MFSFTVTLSCCNTPGLRHVGVAPVTREIGGMTFDIRQRGGYAEAIRTNAMWRPRMADVANNGGRAIILATGCEVAWMRGDPSVLLAGLDCGDGSKVPRKPRARTVCTGTVSAPYSDGDSDVAFVCN